MRNMATPTLASPSSTRRYSNVFLYTPHHSHISEAISTAASPLRNSFQLSCRSPLSPRTQSFDHGATSTYLNSSRFIPSIAETSQSKTVYSGEEHQQLEYDEDGASSLTVFSPTDRTWFLSPSTPSLLKNDYRSQDGKIGVASAINIILGKTVGVSAYTVTSAIFAGVGSVGMTISLWVIGSIISFCGLAVYLELGTKIPKSGGERVYLERIFPKPKMLASCIFMSYAVLLGFSTPNAIVLGDYVLYALDVGRNNWNVRVIAALSVSALCYIHARLPKLGLKLINILGVGKLLILAIVIVSGIAGGLMGVGRIDERLGARRIEVPLSHDSTLSTAQRNFSNIWEGSSTQPYDYATALLKVIYCFRGYSTANQVLSDVRNPVRTLRIAAPIALGIVSIAYLAINLAFFLVVDKEDFKSSGIVVAGTFFRNVFGETFGAHILPIFVIISAAGNIAATSFTQARVNEELAKDGLLPWSGFFTTTLTSDAAEQQQQLDSPIKKYQPPLPSTTPSRGLLLHWLVSVAVIIIPPPGRVYNFLVDIGGYPVSAISVAVSIGLLYLRLRPSERWSSPYRAKQTAIISFAASNCLLLIFPWIPPLSGEGENAGFAYYAYPATALAVLGSGGLYWCWWRTQGNGRTEITRTGGSSIMRSLEPESRNSLAQDEPVLELADNVDLRRRAPCGCPV